MCLKVVHYRFNSWTEKGTEKGKCRNAKVQNEKMQNYFVFALKNDKNNITRTFKITTICYWFKLCIFFYISVFHFSTNIFSIFAFLRFCIFPSRFLSLINHEKSMNKVNCNYETYCTWLIWPRKLIKQINI